MPFFKKREKKKDKTKKDTLNNKNPKLKKKTKFGFKHKDKTEKGVKNSKSLIDEPKNKDKIKDKKEKQNITKKKKNFLTKDMKGKPVFLEDTGEKLGTVFDTIINEDKNIIGYKIKDIKSNSILSFTLDNFEYDKNGLVFVPGWYNNALKIIEKLEFKDRISPELTALLSDDAVTNEELYNIFVKHDSDMVKYIDDAKSLREMLSSRLKVLQKQRISLKDELMDLTEKRLIKDIDRKEFSEDVMNHRRKVNILDLNINKCKDLIKRLDNTSFGVLEREKLSDKKAISTKFEKNLSSNILDTNISKNNFRNYKNQSNSDEFKNKYFELKEKYSELEQDYRELKLAVNELMEKENV